jgi:hypothetical protein
MSDFENLLVRFAAAATRCDGHGLAALFTPDGVYDDYFFGPYVGRDAISGMLAHFAEGGEDFRWTFHDPLANAHLAYASYRFSYTSKAPDAARARVCFAGMSRFELNGGLIARYSEVFDRGMALAQQNFAPERLSRICQRYAHALKQGSDWADHVAPPG